MEDPLTIIDPKQISLEYIELLHMLDKVQQTKSEPSIFSIQFRAKELVVFLLLRGDMNIDKSVSSLFLKALTEICKVFSHL